MNLAKKSLSLCKQQQKTLQMVFQYFEILGNKINGESRRDPGSYYLALGYAWFGIASFL